MLRRPGLWDGRGWSHLLSLGASTCQSSPAGHNSLFERQLLMRAGLKRSIDAQKGRDVWSQEEVEGARVAAGGLFKPPWSNSFH